MPSLGGEGNVRFPPIAAIHRSPPPRPLPLLPPLFDPLPSLLHIPVLTKLPRIFLPVLLLIIKKKQRPVLTDIPTFVLL